MRRLLVTGGAGFIGTNFVRHWLQSRPEDRVVVLDIMSYAANPQSLADLQGRSLRLVRGDIRDQEAVAALLRAEGIDTVVHFAAESHVDRSIEGPDAFIDTNIVGTHALLKAVRSVWLAGERTVERRFHHVSTDEVYGSLEPQDAPFNEATPFAPNSPYSASKAASDHLVRAYHRTYGLPVTISHCSNNYGPYQFPEKLIALTATHALLGRDLPVYGDGRHVRDWLYVEDHCRAIGAILDRGRPGETYDIGGGTELGNLEIVEILCERIDRLFDRDPELARRFPDAPAARGVHTASLIRHVADRPGHDRRYAIDAAKAARELGFSPAMSFRDGIDRTLRWYVDNEHWWRRGQADAVPPGRARLSRESPARAAAGH